VIVLAYLDIVAEQAIRHIRNADVRTWRYYYFIKILFRVRRIIQEMKEYVVLFLDLDLEV